MGIQLGNENILLYMQIYNHYKKLICDAQLTAGTKLPSIRRASTELGVSRTTVETAYMTLAADGYIVSKAQSGFYVNDLNFIKHTPQNASAKQKNVQDIIKYDFLSANADPKSFNFNLWRRYIKSALRRDDLLLSYGEVQGEYELRSAIARYISETRNVVCSAENIVVGAGVQSLLHIICALSDKKESIYFSNSGFSQGVAIFKDHGWKISETAENASVIYTTPSHVNSHGGVMNVSERIEMIKKANDSNSLIIEDDYESEFSYFNRPAPSMQGLSGGHGVVYMSTFSRLLLPSIRISFMVLPPELLERYLKIASRYNQTASKTEQLALCSFIRDGHLAAQIRRLRKLYSAKSKRLAESVRLRFGNEAEVSQNESGLSVRVEFEAEKSGGELMERCRKNGLALAIHSDGKHKTAVLSCTSVDEESFDDAVEILYKVLIN